MSAHRTIIGAFAEWYKSLPLQRDGFPSRGAIGTALVVLDHLKSDCSLNLESHQVKDGVQIKGASGPAVARILAEFGETRPFIKEGGRTNRGGPGHIKSMLSVLKKTHLASLDGNDRAAEIQKLQSFLVERVRDYHNRQRLKISYDPTKSTWQCVRSILDLASETGKEGPVAQYLVGAKLQLRFPDEKIGNESYSVADDQLGRPGDFCVGDTAVHVTIAPMPKLYEKCKANLAAGYRVLLLVPYSLLAGTRQNAEITAPGQIMVEPVESFIAQNIEELSGFSSDRLAGGVLRLLQIYNDRVNATELDKSMLIEIPQNLRKLLEK